MIRQRSKEKGHGEDPGDPGRTHLTTSGGGGGGWERFETLSMPGGRSPERKISG